MHELVSYDNSERLFELNLIQGPLDMARENLIGYARTNAINTTDGAGTATTPSPLRLQPLDLASVSSKQTRRIFVAATNAAALLTAGIRLPLFRASCKTFLHLVGFDSLLTIYN